MTKDSDLLNQFIIEALKTESNDFESIRDRLNQTRTIRLLHAAMGLSTEANEFLDALKKWIFYGKEIDEVNLKEELGDINWYETIAIHELGSSFEEILTLVIDKLTKRYDLSKQKQFTNQLAINRNLEEEREILEESTYFDSSDFNPRR